ncbi:MAG: TetR/AcrR family transcriptional regulator [Lachnospiraceae bacterium]|nr:TetR/AcrR family transcriptional regulator [Lachnospiraceae bacterium]
MGKITGLERPQDVPAKVMLLYEAVAHLIAEDVDMNSISVATITEKAGIGKGTAYEYFDSKDDILVCAIIFYVQQLYEKVEGLLTSEVTFAGRMKLLLDEMEKGQGCDRCCSGTRYVHIITDRSGISRLVAQKMQEEPLRDYLPDAVCERILREGIARGEVREDLPMEYMICTLFSKFMAYLMCVNSVGSLKMYPEKVRPYLYRSILKELCVREGEEL